MHWDGPLRFHGRVVWLSAEQGGRRSGPPTPDYAATGFVRPLTVETGLASIVVRAADATATESHADAGWLVTDLDYPKVVEAGDVIVITEGPKPVGFFYVDSVS